VIIFSIAMGDKEALFKTPCDSMVPVATVEALLG